MLRDSLADTQIDAALAVDEHANRGGAHAFGQQHFDVRLGRREALLDLCLDVLHLLLPLQQKRWAAKPTSRCGPRPQMKVLAAREYSPGRVRHNRAWGPGRPRVWRAAGLPPRPYSPASKNTLSCSSLRGTSVFCAIRSASDTR